MENPLAVQVLQTPGDVQRQTDPDAPRQAEVAVQQLLQVTAVDVLQSQRRDKRDIPSNIVSPRSFNQFTYIHTYTILFFLDYTSVI